MGSNSTSISNASSGTAITYAEQLKIFSEHVKTVLTLSSASLPVIVGLLGTLVGKDPNGNVHIPDFVKANFWIVGLALLAFLTSIVGGVIFSYLLCRSSNNPYALSPAMNVASLFTHGAFIGGVVCFFFWAMRMVWALH
jgi:hypothetical protein